VAVRSISLAEKGGGSRLAVILLFLFLLLIAVPLGSGAWAGSFQVDPVRLELRHDGKVASLSIRNLDTQPVAIRIATYRWTQQEGEDVYSETSDLIASPPIFTIPPNGRQIVRIGPRAGRATGAYRIIVEEIPRPSAPGSTAIQVALRVNLPLYVLAPGKARPHLSWSAWRNRDGDVIVEGRNTGARYGQVLGLAAVDAAGRETLLSSQMGVVLPGSARRWNAGRRPELATGSDFQLKVRNAGGQVKQNRVVLEQR